jgi:hypothetical protein
METSVSLTVLTRRQMFRDGPEELVEVLQIRGEENHETGWPESYPGVCQPMVHGKVESGETELEALQREIKQEVGDNFFRLLDTDNVQVYTSDCAPAVGKVVETNRKQKPEKLIIHYAVEVPPHQINLIRFNASTGGLRYLRERNLIRVQDVNHHGYHKATGVESHSITVMFDDDFEAAKTAFTVFGGRSSPHAEVVEEALLDKHLDKLRNGS